MNWVEATPGRSGTSTRRHDTEVLIPKEAIARRIAELGEQISRDYAGRVPILIGILKGSVVFLSDLVRNLTCDIEVDFISISSYGQGTSSSGTVRLLKDLDLDVSGRDVLVVEDIVDSGLSLAYIRKNLAARNPRSLRMVVLLDKRERRTTGVEVDYVGFRVPNAFVVGFGLDYRELYRGLPEVAVLSRADLESTESPAEFHRDAPGGMPPE
jgi:hypoxanthine phosphoribosyltransferase